MVIVKMERHKEEIQRVWPDDGFGQLCPRYPHFPRKPPRNEDGYSGYGRSQDQPVGSGHCTMHSASGRELLYQTLMVTIAVNFC